MKTRHLVGALLFAAWGCEDPIAITAPNQDGGVDASLPDPPVDSPILGVTEEELKLFRDGDQLFDLPMREADGLGPVYADERCSGCHDRALRGPGLVRKMSIVELDGITPAADQSLLPLGNTIRPRVAGGATMPLLPPDDPRVRITTRSGPPVLGRGYMEAVSEDEILRVEAEQRTRTDGISGRANWVIYDSLENSDIRFHRNKKGDRVLGRFGLKARIATLDDFTADAFVGDMGITSPMRPTEVLNPEGLLDDKNPGVDVSLESVNRRAMYLRLLAMPPRKTSKNGAALFDSVHCSVCHTPSMRTRADYPIAIIRGKSVATYTDQLLHDMGDTLADSVVGTDGDATYREWRTAPLIGVRYMKSFLHDGRAKTVRDAILLHDGPGSEATDSLSRYRALSDGDKAALDAFVTGL